MESNIQISYKINKFIKLVVCLFIGMYLALIPLPDWLSIIRPDFFTLTLVYLLIQDPPKLSLPIIFFLGIFVDVLLASPIGAHSLAFVVMSVIALKLYRQLRFFPIWQQSAYIASIVFLCNIIVFIVMYFMVQDKKVLYLFISWLSTFIIWPWFRLFFDQIFQNEVVG